MRLDESKGQSCAKEVEMSSPLQFMRVLVVFTVE